MLDLGADQVPKALGLAIPSTLFASADEVIEQTSQCRLMAQSRHHDRADHVHSRAKRTLHGYAPMSSDEPKRSAPDRFPSGGATQFANSVKRRTFGASWLN